MTDKSDDEKKKDLMRKLFGEENTRLVVAVAGEAFDKELSEFMGKWEPQKGEYEEYPDMKLVRGDDVYMSRVTGVTKRSPTGICITVSHNGAPELEIYRSPIICCSGCLVRNGVIATQAYIKMMENPAPSNPKSKWFH